MSITPSKQLSISYLWGFTRYWTNHCNAVSDQQSNSPPHLYIMSDEISCTPEHWATSPGLLSTTFPWLPQFYRTYKPVSLWRKPEHSEKTHRVTQRMYKLHTEGTCRQDQTQVFGVVRQQFYHCAAHINLTPHIALLFPASRLNPFMQH